MTNQKYKIIYLLAIVGFVSVAVYFLFPFGSSAIEWAGNINKNVVEIDSGEEIIYSFIDRGSIEVADKILNNEYELSRFDAVTIDNITWNEDPYSDIYWRFNFYNLEPVRHLLYAWGITHDEKYKDKMVEIIDSFIATGMDSEYAWDLHGVAFRTLTLVDVYWKLENAGELNKDNLPEDFRTNMLATLERHGVFLVDPEHYEGAYNHGFDQSVALYLLAYTMPDLPNAAEWEMIAKGRISTMVDSIIDEDGVLVENSPYYHFYVLEKMWEVNKYLDTYDLYISNNFEEKLNLMIAYGANILQPDLNIPTIGASLSGKIQLAKIYRDMAKERPELLYVLTQGQKGKRPEKTNIHYPESGQTIMRSGWSRGKEYQNETQLIFDVGGYRTNHSDLDALSFHLYGNGLALMPDAGLYTYDIEPYRSYFHGTRSHNTVVVDGQDQSLKGLGINDGVGVYAGPLLEGDGYVYQSGVHELYEGVAHTRAITMIEDNVILIFDRLASEAQHDYEQMFHLFPGAELELQDDDLTVVAKGERADQTVTIKQFVTDGLELKTALDNQEPLDGICSFEYTVATPCYALAYSKSGDNSDYVTAIVLGDEIPEISYDKTEVKLSVTTKTKTYTVSIDKTEVQEQKIIVDKQFNIDDIYKNQKPVDILNDGKDWLLTTKKRASGGVAKTTRSSQSVSQISVTAPNDGTYLEVEKSVQLDLSNQDLYFKMRVFGVKNLGEVDIHFSNDNWRTSAHFNVTNEMYDVNREGEWIQFGAIKTEARSKNTGAWTKDPTFDWSRVDGIRFLVANKPGVTSNVTFRDFTLIEGQAGPQAVFVFDDGWESVSMAADILKDRNIKGNVAVISNSIGANRYLDLPELISLQNDYGWNIVNHTSLHKDAVVDYSDKDNLDDYEHDITNALSYLITHDLNSAPNWLIYPYGKTNGDLKMVANKYYKFARATIDGPERFPFPEPLEVKALSIYSGRITVDEIEAVLEDAVSLNQTVMFMFHKFTEAPPGDYHEWQLSEFEAILDAVQDAGIPIMTLSEMDASHSVPETVFELQEYEPEQYQLTIAEEARAWSLTTTWSKFLGWF